MMQIMFEKNFKPNVVHYDISIDPNKPKYLMRQVFEEARKKLFLNRYPAFDGKKNAFSAGPLPIKSPTTTEVTVSNEDDNNRQYKITFKEAQKLDLSCLKNVKVGLEIPKESKICIMALDIILRNAPALSSKSVIGRSFFTQPRPSDIGTTFESLGGGMDVWVGLFQSAILGWKPFLNVDVVHKGFPIRQPVLNLMKTICGCDGQGGGGRPPGRQQYGRQYEQGPTELTVNLIERYRGDIDRFLKGLKVVYEIPGQATSRRTQRVNGLVTCSRKNTFENNGHTISVEQYYKEAKTYNIKHPDFPCLWVGGRNRNIHVPPELCTIVEGQTTEKKLDEKQTAKMIKFAATNTEERQNKIMNAFNRMEYNNDPCMNEFGISVSGKFEEVPARVLYPPILSYNIKNVPVAKGQWRADKFLEPSSLIAENYSWTILNLDDYTKNENLHSFVDEIKGTAKTLNVSIGDPSIPFKKLELKDARSYFEDQKKNGIKLVIVIISDKKEMYSKVKQISELNVGILTQCLKSKTLSKISRDRTPATITNIIMKLNAKLNGINHKIASKQQQYHELPYCLTEPCMIVGADVTHPPRDAQSFPSIAAVVASHEPRAFHYNAEIRLQPPNVEIIRELAAMMKIQLERFHEKTNHWPRRIIFYRDGVSDSQFDEVLKKELMAIRKACKLVEPTVANPYKPPITFLVVQKRHHIRIFPARPNQSDDRNMNVRAGTIVDTTITHPSDIDFYLVSHASIQGTARPTKYRCLWDDADMSEDQIEQLTYFLCHMFSRCTRSVSYPAPTYNAHLAAFRARAWIQNVKIQLDNLSQEQKRKLTLRPEIVDGFPMFFV